MPFAWLVIVLLVWFLSTMNKAKKLQEKQQAAQQKSRQLAAQRTAPMNAAASALKNEDSEEDEDGWPERAMPASPQPAPRAKMFSSQPAAQPAPRPEEAHHAQPLEAHMHTPVMGAEGEGTEGIDCCHEYMLGQPEAHEQADFLPLQEEEENERAKALLQGVIFSEILGRRPMKRYGGKRA